MCAETAADWKAVQDAINALESSGGLPSGTLGSVLVFNNQGAWAALNSSSAVDGAVLTRDHSAAPACLKWETPKSGSGFLTCLEAIMDAMNGATWPIDMKVESGSYVGMFLAARSDSTWVTGTNATYTVPTGKNATVVAASCAVNNNNTYRFSRVTRTTDNTVLWDFTDGDVDGHSLSRGWPFPTGDDTSASNPAMYVQPAGATIAVQVKGDPSGTIVRSGAAWAIIHVFDAA